MFLTSLERPPDSSDPRPFRRLKNRRPTGGLPSILHRPEKPVTANAGKCVINSDREGSNFPAEGEFVSS